MVNVEKHAQAILDRHKPFRIVGESTVHCSRGLHSHPCEDCLDAEAVLVAAREHDTRQAEVERLLGLELREHRSVKAPEQGVTYTICCTCQCVWPCSARTRLEAALRLLRGGEA